MLVRGPSLAASMSYYLIQQIEAIAEHHGAHLHRGRRRRTATTTSSGSTLRDNDDRRRRRRSTPSRLFVFIGAAPRTDWLDGVGRARRARLRRSPAPTWSSTASARRGWTLDRPPYHLETSVPGVFVAGDVRAESVKRVASAVGEGAMAVMLVHRYLEKR